MIIGERVIAVIPVRGGSKGIPRKNECDLGGHPLMAWAIQTARCCRPEIDRVIVSTEDETLACTAKRYGAEVYPRSAHLASDTVGVHQVLLDLRSRLKEEGETAKYWVLLEAPSAFRSPELLREALSLLESGYTSAASFRKARTHPIQAWKLLDGSISTYIPDANPWVTRQELPEAYELTGEVYAFEIDALRRESASLLQGRCGAVLVDSDLSVDINSPWDLELARVLFPRSPLARLSMD